MFTIGDILATVAIAVGSGLVIWALGLTMTLLFPETARRAAQHIERRPGKSFLWGVMAIVPLLVLIIVLAAIPSPITRALAAVVACGGLVFATLGLGGLGWLVGDRMHSAAPELGWLQARSKGLAVVTIVGMAPVVGWFFTAPIMLILSLGAATRALSRADREEATWPTAQV